MTRPPVPPFTEETARAIVRAAEVCWNSREPNKIALAYAPDSRWCRVRDRSAEDSGVSDPQVGRCYGNENREFDVGGLTQQRFASLNDLPIDESERKFHWPLGRRPDDHPALSELGFQLQY